VFKKKPFGEFPQQYKKYMIMLNKKYIEELRENKNCVTFNYVMEFVNKVAAIAEEEQHHPDITISYGDVGVELTTHAIEGLSENDFILASKIDLIKI
jgi:4a-hydroxytetrahydrobiopterin dehydratase